MISFRLNETANDNSTNVSSGSRGKVWGPPMPHVLLIPRILKKLRVSEKYLSFYFKMSLGDPKLTPVKPVQFQIVATRMELK